jgi:hypothetical protein
MTTSVRAMIPPNLAGEIDAAGVKSIMSLLTWPAIGINQLSGLV